MAIEKLNLKTGDLVTEKHFNTLDSNFQELDTNINTFKTDVNTQLNDITQLNFNKIKAAIGDNDNHKLTADQLDIIKNTLNIENKVSRRIFFSDIKKFSNIYISATTKDGIELTANDFVVTIHGNENTYWGDTITENQRKAFRLSSSDFKITKNGSGYILNIINNTQKAYQCGYIDYEADLFNINDELDYVYIQCLIEKYNSEVINIPSGEYRLNKSLSAYQKEGINICGQGETNTKIIATECYPIIDFVMCDYFNISNLNLIGNNCLNEGLVLNASSRGEASNITINNCYINFREIYLCIYNTFTNLYLQKGIYGFIGQRFISQTTFINCKFMYNKKQGILLSGDFGNQPYNNTFVTPCIEVNGSIGYSQNEIQDELLCGIELQNCRNITFITPYFEGNGTASKIENKPCHILLSDYVQDNGTKIGSETVSFLDGYYSKPVYVCNINSSINIKFESGRVEVDETYYSKNSINCGNFFGDEIGTLIGKNIEVTGIDIMSSVLPFKINNYQGFKMNNCRPANRLFTLSSDVATHVVDNLENLNYIIKSLQLYEGTDNFTVRLPGGTLDRVELYDITKNITITAIDVNNKPIIKFMNIHRCKNISLYHINFNNELSEEECLLNIISSNIYSNILSFNANNSTYKCYGIKADRNSSVILIGSVFDNMYSCLKGDMLSNIYVTDCKGTNINTALISSNGSTIISNKNVFTSSSSNIEESGGIIR